MSEDRWDLRVTVAAGMSTSGKSTFALRYLVAQDFTCRFIFDDGAKKMAHKLGLVCAETWEECEMAVEDGFVCFDPSILFPGRNEEACDAFTDWSYKKASTLPGRKILLVDEVWQYCSPHYIPVPLAQWIQNGAKHGMECFFCTQLPSNLNKSFNAHITETVCFFLQGHTELDWVKRRGFEPDEISRLPLGCFVSRGLTGAEARARLW